MKEDDLLSAVLRVRDRLAATGVWNMDAKRATSPEDHYLVLPSGNAQHLIDEILRQETPRERWYREHHERRYWRRYGKHLRPLKGALGTVNGFVFTKKSYTSV